MMPTAKGSISGSDSNFTSEFKVNGVPRHFSGTFTKAEKPWSASNATLTYEDAEDLNGSRDLDVVIGNDDVVMKIKVSGEIKGTLNEPFNPISQAKGHGTWTVNKA
ncbi:hypothetical protein FANTH_13780 [Fusarium anthophilum]|uniref:Uncharacterized protein n=1 Tax=Fusarium anthophilum TaxID=48485 RepID=A0A8H4YMI3_9HYPO|nr:hypothetical protein FANTH_13780 [Fusarium anthophilum]